MADYKDQLLAGIAQPKPCQAPTLLYKTGEAMAAIGCGNTKFYELINDGDARRPPVRAADLRHRRVAGEVRRDAQARRHADDGEGGARSAGGGRRSAAP